jgi:hypothetical protein
MVESFKTRKNKANYVLYNGRIKKKTLEHPLSLLLPPFPLPFFFSTTISSMINSNLEFFQKSSNNEM